MRVWCWWRTLRTVSTHSRGQGINLGLSDVRVLAEELSMGKAKGLAIDSPVVLKRYQRQRKTENLAMMAAMEGSSAALVAVIR